MLDPLTSRLPRITVVPLVVAAALALAGPASATEYCVAPNASCAGGNNLQDFQDALNHAAADSSPDRILLGASTYTAKSAGGFVYNPPGDWPVEVVGAGASSMIVTGAAGGDGALAVFGGAGTLLHDLHVVIPPHAASNSHGLWTNGTARRVTVTEDPSQSNSRIGVMLGVDGVLEDHSVVDLARASGTTGVSLDDGPQLVRDSTIGATVGVLAGDSDLIDRTRISAGMAGVVVSRDNPTITSSRIQTTESGSVGIEANAAGNTTVELDGVTIAGPSAGLGSGTGIDAFNSYTPAANVAVHLRNGVIRGYSTSLYAGGLAPGHAQVTASYSDYDPAGNFTTGTTAAITQTNVSNVGNVGFGDGYQLVAGSPLIDAGDPATAPGSDIDGNPLLADGNGDGVARRDIGAFEFAPPPPAGGDSSAPSESNVGALPGQPAIAARDATAPVVSGLRVARRAFAIGRARTAISARLARGTRFTYSLSEAATVAVKIRRLGSKRTAGRLIRAAKSGSNSLRFSGRIGTKALRPGRYTAVVTATDAAGNRSAAKSVRFRVLKG